jgi:hypothetical protein
MIHLKRAYEPATPKDGKRFLVDRLWPRGIKKSSLRLDTRVKEVAPSVSLRGWFGHEPKSARLAFVTCLAVSGSQAGLRHFAFSSDPLSSKNSTEKYLGAGMPGAGLLLRSVVGCSPLCAVQYQRG